jgi:hypothetical protein
MPPRRIVESESYIRDKARIQDDRLLDEVKFAFDLHLANDPYLGTPLSYFSGLYVLETESYLPRVPSFRVLYKYDENNPQEIELLAIERISAFE